MLPPDEGLDSVAVGPWILKFWVLGWPWSPCVSLQPLALKVTVTRPGKYVMLLPLSKLAVVITYRNVFTLSAASVGSSGKVPAFVPVGTVTTGSPVVGSGAVVIGYGSSESVSVSEEPPNGVYEIVNGAEVGVFRVPSVFIVPRIES